MDAHDIRLLDELAANALAPTTVQLLDGWLLRASPGIPFRRASSVLAIRGTHADLAGDIALVESFYSARGLPARFQVSPVALPSSLDGELAARGYEIEAPVVIGTAPSMSVLGRTEAILHVDVVEPIDDECVGRLAAVHAGDEHAAERIVGFGRVLRGIGPTRAAALARDEHGTPVAAGFAVAERGWVGLFGMGTRAAERGKGAGTAIIHALARWAGEQRAEMLYLQVEVENASARRLYARAGFSEVYGYHYRTRFGAV